ncbi:hypothetical protein M0R45_028633 [Rubus argutus]|uniref:Uncharacterized protein n=1 Tax=Rubus argutus TaxID=59490 RepID=A0AAW1W9Y3_RUBAR
MALVVPELSPEGIYLLQKMLALNPSKRLSAEECLDHPYFLQLDDDGMALLLNVNQDLAVVCIKAYSL